MTKYLLFAAIQLCLVACAIDLNRAWDEEIFAEGE